MDEVKNILSHLTGRDHLAVSLLYGAGLRVSELLRLRVKDVDFGYKQLIIRETKGQKDRVTMLPETIIEPLKKYIEKVKKLHSKGNKESSTQIRYPQKSQ